MKFRSVNFAACCFAATAFPLALAACDSSDSRAREAYGAYQTAAAMGDLNAARLALLQAVAAKDDDPTFWSDLGNVQLELGNYNDAYYALSRAYELDRSNVQLLAALTQLALVSGNIDLSEKHARQLTLLAPNHPAAKLAFGYVALRRQDLDEADRQVDSLLQQFPFDSQGKLLKARILLARDERDQSIKVLQDQLKAKPEDRGAERALMFLYERAENWPGVVASANRLVALNPKDKDAGLTAIRAAFRAGNLPAALRASEPFLDPEAPGTSVDAALRLWSQYWKSPRAVEEARKLSQSAGPQQRLAYATYFNAVDSPDDAAALVGESPRLPVTRANTSANAIIAESLALRGETDRAAKLFDQILALEPDHVYALRGRISLYLRLGAAKAAIADAQRLVSVQPQSARDRLLLARVFEVTGDRRQYERTLWDAFHEIPANRELFEALRTYVQKTGGPEAARSVEAEFDQQRDMRLIREFV